MFSRSILLFLAAIWMLAACGGVQKTATPLETFQTYAKAIKKKDTATMKLLLSNATIKMHEKEAKSQGVTVDDIVKRETLFAENQKNVDYRNEKIDGDNATLEIKDSSRTWVTLPFVREDGVWKIDKAGYADQIEKEIEEQNRKFDDPANFNIQPETP